MTHGVLQNAFQKHSLSFSVWIFHDIEQVVWVSRCHARKRTLHIMSTIQEVVQGKKQMDYNAWRMKMKSKNVQDRYGR